ncbi:MAG: carbamate kinase [Nocardioidaceae bacterium]
MRLLVALGGNALTGPDGSVLPRDQIASAKRAMSAVADLVAAGDDVVVTHGNGPQVGALLVRNELAASAVPPDPLDWCVAQTQATLGFVLLDALEAALTARGLVRRTAALVTRVLVDEADPAFRTPTKPIGRFLSASDADGLVAHGQRFADFGARGWRRVVPSPRPREILDVPAIRTLVDAGFLVVANGGGGVPVVSRPDGTLQGIQAVVDKDLGAALLGIALDVDKLLIATDVENAVLGFGTSHAKPLEELDVAEMRRYLEAGEFGSGSMGPKADAVCRFVEATGKVGVITSLDAIVAGAAGRAGTVVVPTGAAVG